MRHADGQPFDLCHPQRRVWFSELLAPGTGVGNLAGCVHLEAGPDRLPALAAAIGAVLRRHDALRLRLVPGEGSFCQQALGPPPEMDPRPWELGESREPLLEESRRAFPLLEGPPVMIRPLRLPGGRIGWFFKYHHIFVDAWTVALLNRQILRAFTTGQAPGPAPSFLEFMERERRWLASPERAEHEAFWRDHLSGLAPEPSPGGQPAILTRRWEHDLGPALSEAIRGLCEARGSTVFRFFLALFAAHFARWERRDEVVLSTGHHNRIGDREKAMAGMTVSTLPIRLPVDPGQSFAALLAGSHARSSACLRHQQYPYDLLAQHLRASGQAPLRLLRCFVNHVPSLPGGGEPGAPTVERYSPGADLAELNVKINPNQRPREAPLQLGVDARLALYDGDDLRQLFAMVERLAREVVARPDAPLEALDRVPRRLRSVLRGPARPLPQPVPLHGAFAAVAAARGDATAVVDAEGSLSYADLAARVEALAARLQARGIGPGQRVALRCRRRSAYLVGLLAVARLGATWLPLTPDTPPRRAAWILADAEASLVLVDGPWEAPEGAPPRLQVEDGEGSRPLTPDPSTRGERGAEGEDAVDPESAAYLLYTSGSTGHPKGALVPHRALRNLCAWLRELQDLGPDDRCSAYCSFGFDVSVAELLAPLLAGATVVIVPEEARRDLSALGGFLRDQRVSVATLPTRVGELFLGREPPPTLRLLAVAGEALRPCAAPPYSLINAYGPTEACVYATAWEHRGEPGAVPIGHPAPNSVALVVDEGGALCARGEEGELWLAGAPLALGYAGAAAGREGAFQPNPFARDTGEALAYRSGDRVRQRADGALLFLGRQDRQLKLGGVRVELEEIERCLASAPGVATCAVLLREEGERSLLAACSPEPGARLEAEALLAWAREHLPTAMVPAELLLLPAVPLTPGGKTDRDAILAQRGQASASPGEPRDEGEELLLALFRRVLDREDVGVDDSFFERGGDSLAAMELFVEIERAFGRVLPVSALFDKPTVASLARVLAEEPPEDDSPLAPLRDGDPARTLLCVHDFTCDLVAYGPILRSLEPGPAVRGLRWDPALAAGVRSLEELATRYTERLRRAQPRGPYRLLGYSIGGTIAWEMARQLEASGETVAFLGLIDTPNYAQDADLLERFLRTAARNILSWLRGVSWSTKLAMLSAGMGRFPSPRRILGVVEAQRRMRELAMAYRPGPFAGEALLFRSAARRVALGDDLGWGELAARLVIVPVGGDHIMVMGDEHGPAIARVIDSHPGFGSPGPDGAAS